MCKDVSLRLEYDEITRSLSFVVWLDDFNAWSNVGVDIDTPESKKLLWVMQKIIRDTDNYIREMRKNESTQAR